MAREFELREQLCFVTEENCLNRLVLAVEWTGIATPDPSPAPRRNDRPMRLHTSFGATCESSANIQPGKRRICRLVGMTQRSEPLLHKRG